MPARHATWHVKSKALDMANVWMVSKTGKILNQQPVPMIGEGGACLW